MAASPDVPTLSLTETEVLELEQPAPKRLKLSTSLTGTGAAAASSMPTVGLMLVDDDLGSIGSVSVQYEQQLLQSVLDDRPDVGADLLLMRRDYDSNGGGGGGGGDISAPMSPSARILALHRLIRSALTRLERLKCLQRLAELLRCLIVRVDSPEGRDLCQELALLMLSIATSAGADEADGGADACAEACLRCLLDVLLDLPAEPSTATSAPSSSSTTPSNSKVDEAAASIGLTLCGLDCIRQLLASRPSLLTLSSLMERLHKLLAATVSRPDPRLVAHALVLTGAAMSPRDRLLPPRVTCAELAGFMTGHEDPRVRWAAHACHLAWLRRTSSVDLSTPVPLELAHAAMDADDDPAVRAVCVDIALAGAVAAVAAADVEDSDAAAAAAAVSTTKPTASSAEVVAEDVADADAIDAGDAAFRRLAVAMQDASPIVRVRAACALGRLAGRVSEAELAATLDRQVMTDLRLRRRPNDLQSQQRQRDRRTGAPIGDVELKDVTLLSLGSSGAFVNGFEDESSAVRAAAVRSAGRLAERCPAFADQCADVLVDMLADDIHAVRLAAVRALARLAEFRLAGPQLQVCLAALKEDNAELRRGLRDLLANCGLADTDCLRTLLAGLLDNLTRYPADKHCVWRCSAAVGRHHSGLLQLSVGDLLCLHPYLQGAEPMKEDPAYTAVLLAVLNATARLPQLRALLPPYAKRHYAYLRAALLGLTPALPSLDAASTIPSEPSSFGIIVFNNSNEDFFAATLAKIRAQLLEAAAPPTPAGRLRRGLRPLLADLGRLARLSPGLAGRAAFAHDWCRLACSSAAAASSEEAVGLTYRLQLLYSGLPDGTVDCLVRLRQQIVSAASLANLASLMPPMPDPLPTGLGRMSAALLEPSLSGADEQNRKFPAGLPLCIPVRARLRHCPRPDRLRVWLRLPDRRRVVWAPAAAHWIETGAGACELATQLQVTCPQWTDAAQLLVCLAVELDSWSAEVTPRVPVNVQPQPLRKS